jgi:hypothetical protein
MSPPSQLGPDWPTCEENRPSSVLSGTAAGVVAGAQVLEVLVVFAVLTAGPDAEVAARPTPNTPAPTSRRSTDQRAARGRICACACDVRFRPPPCRPAWRLIVSPSAAANRRHDARCLSSRSEAPGNRQMDCITNGAAVERPRRRPARGCPDPAELAGRLPLGSSYDRLIHCSGYYAELVDQLSDLRRSKSANM